MKLGTNVHHVSGQCAKGFQGHGVKDQGSRHVLGRRHTDDGSPSKTVLFITIGPVCVMVFLCRCSLGFGGFGCRCSRLSVKTRRQSDLYAAVQL